MKRYTMTYYDYEGWHPSPDEHPWVYENEATLEVVIASEADAATIELRNENVTLREQLAEARRATMNVHAAHERAANLIRGVAAAWRSDTNVTVSEAVGAVCRYVDEIDRPAVGTT
jgi:DNA-directed RNA polymerase subunit L